jgi:zinc protease
MISTRNFTAPTLLVLLLLISLPLAAAPDIQTWRTSNGARVLFVAAPELPMADVRVVFNAGGARDAKPGVARLMSAMLTQGAGDWGANEIAERMEGVGADMEVGSLRDMAWVSVRSLTAQPAFDTALDTLIEVLGNPSFPEHQLERLRRSTMVAIRQAEQQPRTVASKAFYKALYGAHPYAADPTGTMESVQGVTREDLLRHYEKYYVAKNAVVAMVGALSREQAEHIAERVTEKLAEGEAAPKLPPVQDLAQPMLERLDFPSSQSHVLAGQPGISRGDQDYFPLYVGNHILGGNGLVSLLSEEVREKRGLSYSVYSYFLPMQARGPFLMGLQTKNSQVDQALAVLMETLGVFIEKGPSEADLKAAKQNITGGFPLRIASNSKIVEYLAVIGFYDLPLDYLDTFNAKVEAVTAEQVQDALKRHLQEQRLVTVIVGPVGAPKAAAN